MTASAETSHRTSGRISGGFGSPDNRKVNGNLPEWKSLYWLIAATPATLIFFSDALEIAFYEHARAPNMGPVSQIVLMMIFYACWPVVPWLIWQSVERHQRLPGAVVARSGIWLVLKLAGLALVANFLHMSILTFVLRAQYSPPGWGTADFMFSVTELWVQHGGVWFFVFAVFGCGIYWMFRARPQPEQDQLVYEVRQGNRIVPVAVGNVSWIEACGNYSQLHTSSGAFLVRKSLASIERETAQHGFVRSHRGALVNMAFVSSISPDVSRGGYTINLKTGGLAPLSRRRLSVFREQLAH